MKTVSYRRNSYLVYENGTTVPEGTVYLAVGAGNQLPAVIPESVECILLMDGFDGPLNTIPSTVKSLDIYDIKYRLVPGSIPKVKFLAFGDGFSQKLVEGIVPKVSEIIFGDITQPLDSNSIPGTIKAYYTSPSFKFNVPGKTAQMFDLKKYVL